MLFNSFEFAVFFCITTFIYFAIPHKFRWLFLLTISCIFYMAFIPIYILILALTIIIDYFLALKISKTIGPRRKNYLILSIISTCAVLFVFKYFNFFTQSFSTIASFFDLHYPANVLNIILPIGLSFHTFQSLSYVIEVYRGKQIPESHFGIYSLYVMFYPQLVAGPIERPQNLLHQFRQKVTFEYDRVVSGLTQMGFGLFKKVVIADRLALIVNNVYADPSRFDGATLIIATLAFAFQIYYDFSGYSDIAIGAARILGFKLMDNFKTPYYSKTISEFWTRWHISLSTWFRDYVYIPMGGNRVGRWRNYLNLMITFVLSGFWHGASVNFIIWGGLNGFYLVVGRLTSNMRSKFKKIVRFSDASFVGKFVRAAFTFALIAFAWIFFRASSVEDAFIVISKLTTDYSNIFHAGYLESVFAQLGPSKQELVVLIVAFFGFELFQFFTRRKRIHEPLRNWNPILRWVVYTLLVISIGYFGIVGKSEFIYFQF